MVRRLSAFLLVLACALAPALPAVEALRVTSDCCGQKCCCDHGCAPCLPPAPARTVAPTATAVAVLRESAPRPAPASARLLYFFVSSVPAAAGKSPRSGLVIAPAASVPLFKEHCSFRI